MAKNSRAWVGIALALLSASAVAADTGLLVGGGVYDITGPAAEVMMAGYVTPSQRTAGIQMRLRSRAFVVAESDGGRRVAIVTADLCHVFQAVKLRVVEKLRDAFGPLYDEKNVLLAATHTHAGPGGYSHYKLYNLSSLGYSPQNFEIISEGVFQSIAKAHRNLAPGSIRIAEGKLEGAGRNRSLDAYENNPEEERARWGSDTDPRMVVLKLTREDGKEIGVVSWFALHGTSLPPSNRLISPDNKGFAAYLFEREKGTDYFADETFVAAFANTNAGDVSPNTAGDIGEDGLWKCPLNDGTACMKLAGRMQYEKARELYLAAAEKLRGEVDFRHAYVDMSSVRVGGDFTGEGTRSTCLASIGISMLAGTEDGRGIGQEGRACSSVPLRLKPLCLRDRCQGEKPVAVETGRKRPYPWTPDILPVQVVRVGQLALLALPAELTTMAGRRLIERLKPILAGSGVTHVVFAGYANAYSGYVTTREEFQAQHYEGASTHFGEWTLAAYEQELARLAEAMKTGAPVEPGPEPRDPSVGGSILPDAVAAFDAPGGDGFGSVETDAKKSYKAGQTARVSFWGAYPNNDPMIQSSYVEIQREDGGKWVTVAYDGDAETEFRWERVGVAKSLVTAVWEIPQTVAAGTYRVLVRGKWKERGGALHPYEGSSREFAVGR